MTFHVVRFGWLILVIGVSLASARCGAEEGPVLLGPDAQPPRIVPQVRERQPEWPDYESTRDGGQPSARETP
ncbi:MAG: hypothetical protein WD845_01550, partial [Pirellulales bacterium]